jgi:hypothetical protein
VSLAIFLILSMLGIDFLVYVLFQWTFGDKRCALQRKVEAQRRAMEAAGPMLVKGTKAKETSKKSGTDLTVYGAQVTVPRRLNTGN